MRLGVVVPAFRTDADAALRVARAADGLLDGAFVFDHLWPMGQPGRPALSSFPLLGAIAGATSTVAVGTLVARIGLVPEALLAHEFATLGRIAGDRLVCGIGAGDSLSAAENEAFGVDFAPVAERVAAVARVAHDLVTAGHEVWVGGRSVAVRTAAARAGAALNVWGVDAETLVQEGADYQARCGDRAGEVTWGGQVLVGRSAADAGAKLEKHGGRPGLVHGSVEQVAAQLLQLAAAGATWAVCAPLDVATDPEAVDLLAEVRSLLR